MKFVKKYVPLLAFLSFSAHASEYAAKALFFGEDDSVKIASSNQPAVAKKLVTSTKVVAKQRVVQKKTTHVTGASYYILLKNPDGSTSKVLANRTFYSGDRFQLAVKVKNASYVYIVNEEENGVPRLLYPQNGYSNYIPKMGEVVLPVKGYFEFDSKPGNEKLLVYVSPEPINGDVVAKIANSKPDVVQYSLAQVAEVCNAGEDQKSTYASKGISFSDEVPCSNSVDSMAKPASAYASKGITFGEDNASDAASNHNPASYVVKTNPADKNLYMKINLSHQ